VRDCACAHVYMCTHSLLPSSCSSSLFRLDSTASTLPSFSEMAVRFMRSWTWASEEPATLLRSCTHAHAHTLTRTCTRSRMHTLTLNLHCVLLIHRCFIHQPALVDSFLFGQISLQGAFQDKVPGEHQEAALQKGSTQTS